MYLIKINFLLCSIAIAIKYSILPDFSNYFIDYDKETPESSLHIMCVICIVCV